MPDNKEIETILKYHSKGGFLNAVKDLTEKIDKLKVSGQNEIQAMQYKVVMSTNHNVQSTVEICVMNRVTIAELEIQRDAIERFVASLDNAIDSLPETQNKIILLRYFSPRKMEYYKIAWEVNYSEDNVKKLNYKALSNINQSIERHNWLQNWLKLYIKEEESCSESINT